MGVVTHPPTSQTYTEADAETCCECVHECIQRICKDQVRSSTHTHTHSRTHMRAQWVHWVWIIFIVTRTVNNSFLSKQHERKLMGNESREEEREKDEVRGRARNK
ncbi:hypothetical protein AMECASPLE_037273 [Ameca splendens]|uniref:C2H2-type domain-containing protein n=1 Tax=Ameca splendens TaxID=208324 RepID=A0ABV0ZGK6_9TELE